MAKFGDHDLRLICIHEFYIVEDEHEVRLFEIGVSGCSDGCDSGRAVLASVLRSTSTLATNIGVGLLTWREGVRRWNTSLAFGHGHVGAALTLRF